MNKVLHLKSNTMYAILLANFAHEILNEFEYESKILRWVFRSRSSEHLLYVVIIKMNLKKRTLANNYLKNFAILFCCF